MKTWRQIWAATLCLALAPIACGKSERAPGDEPSAAAGSASGGVRAGVSGSAGATAGNRASAGEASWGGGGGGGGGAAGGMDVGLGGAATDPSEAGASAMGGSGGCLGSYRACGCGCCSNQTARRKCVYPSLGQDLTRIIAADVKLSRDTAACANVACSMGETYFCCEDAPQDGDAATYHTSLSFGGFDRIRLHKLSTECSTFTLLSPAGPAAAQEPGVFPVEVPTGWALESVTTLRCTSSAIGPGAIGAIGQFSLRVLGDACVVDAHLTAFFSDDAQEVRRVRFDADAVPLDLPVARCK